MTRSRSTRFALLVPALVAACSSEGPGTYDDDGNLRTDPEFPLAIACTTQNNDARWEHADPAADFDGFEVRRSGGGPTAHATVRVVRELCTKASSREACRAKIDATPLAGAWDPFGGVDIGPRQATPEYVVATRGDEVVMLGTPDALASALAPITTLEEAAVVAAVHGYRFACRDTSASSRTLAGRRSGDAFEIYTSKGGGCGSSFTTHVVRVEREGRVIVTELERVAGSSDGVACGRRPSGLEVDTTSAARDVGAMLARMAWLEAASVPAFADIARDLVRHGAPEALLRRVEGARQDEIRHARVMRAAARRFGGAAGTPKVRRSAPKSLFELALDNAVEGCMREAYGAIVAAYQAEHAAPSLRPIFAAIAADETAHAALSWDLSDWLEARLSARERALVAEARTAAFAELAASLRAPSGDEATRGGLPSLAVARRLLAGLGEVALAAA